MGYIGNTQQNQNYFPAVDFFSGNGSTTAFTLTRPVASVAAIQAVVSNVAQNPSSAYTVSGSTITFTSAPPSGTNNIYVYYTSPNTQVVAPSDSTVQTSSIANGAVTTAKIADANITQVKLSSGVAGNGPAVSAYASGGQAVSANTYTKVQFNTEIFDTASCFDNSTNYRFTPNVAGYYQITAQVGVNAGSSGSTITTFIFRNGSAYLSNSHDMYTGNYQFANVSDTIYLNGTTDYLEVYVYIGYSANVLTGTSSTRFSGCLVRAA